MTHESLRVAGDAMDQAIIDWMRKQYIAYRSSGAEILKWDIGSAVEMDPEIEAPVRGRDMVAGIPKTLTVDSREIRQALSDPVAQIVAGVRRVLEETPPELAADILDRGMILSGGGILKGLKERLIERRTAFQLMWIQGRPSFGYVVRGNARILEEFDRYKKSGIY